MTVRVVIGSAVAVLALGGAALAGPQPASPTGDKTASVSAATVIQIASVTQQVALVAGMTTVAWIAAEANATDATLAADDGGLDAAPTMPAQHAKRHAVADKKRGTAEKHARAPATPPAKQICVRPIGTAETGTAAWYGGRYVGRRTSSGARLDTIHATAAHRTLPLNSLARVTNLNNGRSVIVRVNDRGPMSESLLIDMSPRAASELRMKQAGLVPVRVEQVVEVPADTK